MPLFTAPAGILKLKKGRKVGKQRGKEERGRGGEGKKHNCLN